MAQALALLQHKIKIAKDLREVVDTMKTMAAVNIGIYEKVDRSLAEYNQVIELGLRAALQKYPEWLAPNPQTGSAGEGVIVFGSDQGMVGQFNDYLSNKVLELLADSANAKIWCVGERVGQKLLDKQAIQQLYRTPDSAVGIAAVAGSLLLKVVEQQEEETIDRLLVCYNKPTSGSGYEPIVKQLLPVSSEWLENLTKMPWPTKTIPQVIEKNSEAVATFIREYLFINICWACAESLVSENIGRLAAMQRAEKNIDELLAEFTISYNQERQSSITEELFDIIFGYDVLKSGAN
ncbi:MAG: F0F1 ATP synthase subunit gamma [Bacillota bacterium]